MPRFVVLHHDHPQDHLDLLLERAEAAWTWRLPCSAFPMCAGEFVAERLSDHRLHYLEYEGPVSQGRGSVRRLTAGEYEVIRDVHSEQSYELIVAFRGPNWQGRLCLARQDGETYRAWWMDLATVAESPSSAPRSSPSLSQTESP
jgi:hypothetical protein